MERNTALLLVSREVGVLSAPLLRRLVLRRQLRRVALDERRDVLSVHRAAVSSVEFDAFGGRFLLSASGDGVVALYDMEQFARSGAAIVAHGAQRVVRPVSFASTSTYVTRAAWYMHDRDAFLTSALNGKLSVWSTAVFRAELDLELGEQIRAMALPSARAGHLLVAAALESRVVRLCDLRSGATTQTIAGHTAAINDLLWLPSDRHLLATCADDRTVRVWDVRRSGQLATLDQYVVDASRVPARGDTGAGAGSSLFARALVPSAHNAPVKCMCVSPDGQRLYTMGNEEVLRCWDTVHFANSLVHFEGSLLGMQQFAKMRCTDAGDCLLVPQGSKLHVFDAQSGQLARRLLGHLGTLLVADSCVERGMLVSGAADSQLLLWSF